MTARTTLTVQDVVRTGLTHTFASAAAAGNDFVNNGRCALYVKNGGGAPINVTIQVPYTENGLGVADRVVAVANGVNKLIGVFPPNIYNVDGKVQVDYSAVTSVTVAVIRF